MFTSSSYKFYFWRDHILHGRRVAHFVEVNPYVKAIRSLRGIRSMLISPRKVIYIYYVVYHKNKQSSGLTWSPTCCILIPYFYNIKLSILNKYKKTHGYSVIDWLEEYHVTQWNIPCVLYLIRKIEIWLVTNNACYVKTCHIIGRCLGGGDIIRRCVSGWRCAKCHEILWNGCIQCFKQRTNKFTFSHMVSAILG